MEKRVGIITFHKADNYGSVLQAYALEEILRRLGYNPEIINFILPLDQEQYRCFRTSIYKNRPKAILGDIAYFPKNYIRKKNFESFRKKYLVIGKKLYKAGDNDMAELNSQYNSFICGSDQIWNLNCTGGFVPEFFLSFVDDDRKKIAYAPSMPAKVNQEFYNEIRFAIERINHISVREAQAVAYLNNSIGVRTPIQKVLDPTVLLSGDEYINNFELRRESSDFVFVYILGDSADTIEKIKTIANEIAGRDHIPVRYVFMRRIPGFYRGQYCYGIQPKQFLEHIMNAKYVVTDSFHATVFSIKFGTKLTVVPRKGSESRMTNFLKIVKLEKCMCCEDETPEWGVVDKAHCDKLLQTDIEKSIDFLKSALEM